MKLDLALERYLPLTLGLASLAAIAFYREDIAFQFASQSWKSPALYNAVFNWASIQSGFVFGIYGFIASKKDGFVGAISQTKAFDRFAGYTRRAYTFGFALTFATVPLLVSEPSLKASESVSFIAIAVWFSVFVWAFCAFLRVAFIFGKIVSVPDRQDVHG